MMLDVPVPGYATGYQLSREYSNGLYKTIVQKIINTDKPEEMCLSTHHVSRA